MSKRGLFLTFEGPEGGGKTTQIRMLVEHLRATGREVMTTREPGGTPTAEAIREVLLGGKAQEMSDTCELLLMLASRADHVSRKIAPALDAGKVVICDRFVDSTAAYQGGARGLDLAEIERQNRFVCQGVWPDLTLLLDIDPEIGLKRAGFFGHHDRIEQAGIEFHRTVRSSFLRLAEAEPDRFEVLNASEKPETVHEKIRAVVEAALQKASSQIQS